MSALRRGLKDHFDLAIAELTRRQIIAAVDKIAKTGKRGAAKDLRKHVPHLPRVVRRRRLRRAQCARRLPARPKGKPVRRGLGRRTKGRALTDEEIIKVLALQSGKLGTFRAIDTHVPTRWAGAAAAEFRHAASDSIQSWMLTFPDMATPRTPQFDEAKIAMGRNPLDQGAREVRLERLLGCGPSLSPIASGGRIQIAGVAPLALFQG